MRQALHIFKKDVRYLRWELGVALLLLAMFVYMQLRRGLLRENYAAIMSYLLLAVWAYLSARLIQAEPISGDRQFWITRPYEWRSLLGAKLLFMVVVIGLPLFVADAFVLGLEGFSVASYSVALLWSLILITASTLIAFLAFATLTKALTEWLLAGIITVAAVYVIAAIANERVWAGVEWMREYGYVAIMFVVAVVVLLRQYRRRGAVVSIAVMAAGLIGSSLFVNYSHSAWALELEARFSKPKVDLSPLQIGVYSVPHTEQDHALGRQQVILLSIPIDISGLREGQDLISDEVGISVKNESGEIWSWKGRQANGSNYLQHLPTGYRLLLQVDRAAFQKENGRPVNIGITLYLTMLQDGASRAIQAGAGPVDVPGAGRCQEYVEDRDSWIICESPLRTPPNLLVVGFGGERRNRFLTGTSYSPFPADAASAIAPLGWYSHSGPRNSTSATLTSLEPVAHFRRDLDLANVYLTDYQVPSPF